MSLNFFPSWAEYGTHQESEYPELWDGCVGAWAPCLGPTRLKLYDLSGNGRHGTLTNMAQASDWPKSFGQHCLDFDGTNDYVIVSGYNSDNQGDYNYSQYNNTWYGPHITICSWVYSTETYVLYLELDPYDYSMYNFLSQSEDNNSTYLGMRLWDEEEGGPLYGNITLSWDTVGYLVDGVLTEPNAWNFVCSRYDGRAASTYIISNNIIRLASYYEYTGYMRATQGLKFPGYEADGVSVRYDDIRIYNRAISFDEMVLLGSQRGIAYTPKQKIYVPYTQSTIPQIVFKGKNLILGCSY